LEMLSLKLGLTAFLAVGSCLDIGPILSDGARQIVLSPRMMVFSSV
jgi:hypothetical protein